MTGFVRRVVTGHDAKGKAIVISDGFTPVVKTDPLRPGYRGTDIWKTKEMPVPITASEPSAWSRAGSWPAATATAGS